MKREYTYDAGYDEGYNFGKNEKMPGVGIAFARMVFGIITAVFQLAFELLRAVFILLRFIVQFTRGKIAR